MATETTATPPTGTRFPRTALALVAYDAASSTVDTCSGDSEALFADYDAALVSVGEAFALDTADRNRREDCMPHAHSSHLLPFFRRMVLESSQVAA